MFEAEKNVIASILIYPELITKIVVPEEYFLDPLNKFCFQMIRKQYFDKKAIDLTSMYEFYKPDFQKINYSKFISYTTDLITYQMVSKSNFWPYQEAMTHAYKNQQLNLAIESFKLNRITQEELMNKIHDLDLLVLNSSEDKLTGDEIFKTITSREKTLSFRFKKLQENANIQEHDLPIIAARPGIGKTAFMLNLIEDLSEHYKCIYFNLEMTEKQLLKRLVSINSKIPMKYFDSPETEYQKSKIRESSENISKKKIRIITGSQTIRTIKSEIIRESQLDHVIVFIDYIGLVRSTEKNQSIYERVTSIVKELRQISLDYNCTIFIASQINRNSEKEKDKRPKISDLKESGELEQSGTTVLMLHNDKPLAPSDQVAEIQVVIGKNRNGPTGIIKLNYNKENQRFECQEKVYINNNDWRNNNA